ncbi:MAG TPA: hypothetical protein VK731_03315 [Candidatus Cybelea sp.]|nr:hypothetical protein [Candidatus Cybelea sp.]
MKNKIPKLIPKQKEKVPGNATPKLFGKTPAARRGTSRASDQVISSSQRRDYLRKSLKPTNEYWPVSRRQAPKSARKSSDS